MSNEIKLTNSTVQNVSVKNTDQIFVGGVTADMIRKVLGYEKVVKFMGTYEGDLNTIMSNQGMIYPEVSYPYFEGALIHRVDKHHCTNCPDGMPENGAGSVLITVCHQTSKEDLSSMNWRIVNDYHQYLMTSNGCFFREGWLDASPNDDLWNWDDWISFSTDVEDGSVTTAKIADKAVTENKLSSELMDKLATKEYTNAKIDDAIGSKGELFGSGDHNELSNRDLPNQHPISAISGLREELDSLNNFVVTTDKIANGAITADKLATNSITGGKIKDGAVTTNKIAIGGVTWENLAQGAVVSESIEIGAVITENIADGAITSEKLSQNLLDLINSGIGYTFTPSVSSSGVISWTNNGGLENPKSVNIKGVKGDKGEQGIQGVQGERGSSGVYVGSGDMPSDCNVQIDPNGTTEDYATKQYVDSAIGDIDTVLDNIIAIQNSLIGGGSV